MLPEGYDGESAEWDGRTPVIRTTIGRIIFNEAFPDDFEYRNQQVLKGDVARLVDEVVHRYDRATVEQVLDNLKNLGFHYATRAGVTIGIEDVTTPAEKAQILDEHEKRAAEGRAAVQARDHHRRRASSGADRDLDRGDRRGPARPWRPSSRRRTRST